MSQAVVFRRACAWSSETISQLPECLAVYYDGPWAAKVSLYRAKLMYTARTVCFVVRTYAVDSV